MHSMSRQSPRNSSHGAESVNKWKIPHYYRRSSAASSLHSTGSDNGNGSTPSTPGVNVMSSPKKVLVEDPKKGKKRPVYRSRKNKKKNGEMVFVNYTVQDSASEDGMTSASTPELPPAEPSPALNPKKKSSRSRMLKIFGSSKAPPAAVGGTNLMACAEDEVMSDPYVTESTSAPAKRSYGSFLKYGRFHGHLPHGRRSESTPELVSEEVVPKSSTYSPNLVKPVSVGRFSSDSPRKINYLGGGNASFESVQSPVENRFLAANQALNSSSTIEADAYSYSKTSFPESQEVDKRHTDENDASIAFSKMFTRKRTNTGGSMSSLISLGHNAQEQLQTTAAAPSLRKNMSTSSVSSISYLSPLRTASPARPRSGTRGSYSHASSSHSRAESVDAANFIGTESFLDSQVANRSGSVTKPRRKQEPFSEAHRLYSTSASNSTILNNGGNQNVVTPSSSSLVTPPPFTSGYTIPSNNSASSTPSVMDLAHATQTGSFGNLVSSISSMNATGNHSTFNVSQPLLDRDSSSEILLEDSDTQTPVDNLPALRGMSKPAETKVEDGTMEAVPQAQHKGASTIDREIKRKSLHNHPNIDALELLLPHGGSTSSSQGGSILTKSTSSVSDNVVISHWQDQGCYSLIDAGSGGGETSNQDVLHDKMVAGIGLKFPSGTTTAGNMDYDMFLETSGKPDEHSQMDLDFDFGNASTFFSEQRNISPESSNSSGQPGVRTETPANGQNSAVTSVANFSPGTNATISVEEIGNVGSYHRSFDRLGSHANAMSHAGAKQAQPGSLYSMGQWKAINNDLDAITDSLGINDETADSTYMYHSERG